MAASSNPFRRGSRGWGMFIHGSHAARLENGSSWWGCLCDVCFASKKSSEREFFVPVGKHLGVKLLTPMSIIALDFPLHECKWEKDSRTAPTESTAGRTAIKHAREILMMFIAGLGVLLTRVWWMPPTTKIGYKVYSSDEMSMRADAWYHHSRRFHSELRSRASHFIL